MKKALPFFGLLLLFVLPVKSQSSYTITPDDTLADVAQLNTLTAYDIYLDNTSGSTLSLAWTRVSLSMPAGWDYSLCDYTNCYAGIPASGTMTPCPAAGQAFLAVNINPYAINGTAVVRIYVYDTSSPSIGDTLTWILSTPTGVEEHAAAAFTLFPNPAGSQLVLHAVKTPVEGATFAILGMDGREVMTIPAVAEETHVDVSALAAGNYLLRYTTPEGNYSVQRLMIAR